MMPLWTSQYGSISAAMFVAEVIVQIQNTLALPIGYLIVTRRSQLMRSTMTAFHRMHLWGF